MPQFKVKTPDGSIVTVNGPEGSTEEQAISYAKANYKPHEPSSLWDAAKSLGRGVAKGAIGLAGLPGDVERLVGKGVKAAGSSLGLPEPPASAERNALPSSEDITAPVEATFGKFQQPKTTLGKYAQSVGEFIPAMAAGPERLGVKVAGALMGGVGSEAAGEAAAAVDPALEPYARFAAGAIGGGAAGGLHNEAQRMAGARQLKGAGGIKDASQTAYKILEQMPQAITPAGMSNLQASVRRALRQENFGPRTAGTTYGLMDDITNATLNNRPARISDIIDIHEELGNVSPQINAKDAAAAQVAREAIRNWLDKNIGGITPELKKALGNWSAYKKLEEVTGGLTTAGHRAGASGTGANYTNTMRQEIRKILDSKSRIRGYPQQERDQMEKIVMGTMEANLSRYGGKFAPTGPVSAIAEKALGWPIIGSTLAFGAKKLGEFLTKREIEKLLTMIQERAPVNAQQAAANKATLAAQTPAKLTAARGAVAGGEHYDPRSPEEMLANPGADVR